MKLFVSEGHEQVQGRRLTVFVVVDDDVVAQHVVVTEARLW